MACKLAKIAVLGQAVICCQVSLYDILTPKFQLAVASLEAIIALLRKIRFKYYWGFIMNIGHIASEALQLSSQDRAILAETIWESLEEPYLLSSDISDEEAIALAKQRDEDIENGHVEPLSHKELMNRLRNEG